MHLILDRLRRLRSAEQGFALVTVMTVMLVASLAAVAAVYATDSDLPLGGEDRQKKGAYAAAEAGVNDYLARLIANVDFWQQCAPPDPNDGIQQRWSGSGPREWRQIPGTNSFYSIELMPANGASQCSTANAQNTFIDTGTGTFRVRSTGRVGPNGKRRSIIATFKRRGFLDYVYFTDFETLDPQWYRVDASGRPTRERSAPRRDIVTWATQECAKYYRDGRGEARFNGELYYDGRWYDFNRRCGEINFVTGDQQRGPFHTNDEILVCGTPSFGQAATDDIEVSAPSPDSSSGGGFGDPRGWRNCGSGAPQVNQPGSITNNNLGVWRKGSPLVTMPPSNTSLRDDALPAYRFKGRTTIRLNGTSMTVTGRRESGALLTNATMPMPTDGLIYVDNDDSMACAGYDPLNPYPTAADGCGVLSIQGTYQRNLTFAAKDDVIVTNDLVRSGDTMLGLIAENWVRVYHPTTGCGSSGGGSNNGGPGEISIDAAILSLNHSFTVDSYWCGSQLGDLHVDGAIAQRFRGPVGTSGGTGYIKDYEYDYRLRFRSPPKFLDPVQASWKLQSQVEQVPAT